MTNAWLAQINGLAEYVERNAWQNALPEFQREQRMDALRTRARILQILRCAKAPLKTLEIAVEEGLSDDGARRHLYALRDEGLVGKVSKYPATWGAVRQ